MDPRIADRIEPFCRLVTDPQIAWYGRPLRDPLRDLVARPDDQTVTDVAAFLQNRGAAVRREPGNSSSPGACAAVGVPQEPAGRGSLTGTVELPSTAKGQKWRQYSPSCAER
jgi:hypothetical protein